MGGSSHGPEEPRHINVTEKKEKKEKNSMQETD